MLRCAAAVLALQGGAAAQELSQGVPYAGPPQAAAGVLTLDQDRLFTASRFGQRTVAETETASRELAAENRRIEAELAVEERALTDRRPGLPAAEFRTLADAFDARVIGIRATQEAKARALIARRDSEQKRFFATAIPILGAILREVGAVAILDSNAIFLASDRVDVTDEAIARIDAILGDGADAPSSTDTGPDGAAAPADAPQSTAP